MRLSLPTRALACVSLLISARVTAEIPSAPRFVVWGDIGRSITIVQTCRPVPAMSLTPTTPTWSKNINNFSVYFLAFWTSFAGPADNALKWTRHSDEEQKAFVKRYHDAGIKLAVSAFGGTDAPQAMIGDAAQVARKIAAFVKENHLDGVDVDYEQFDTMEYGTAEAWLVTLTRTLRQELPRPRYFITHAPIAPWFSGDGYVGGGYREVHRQVGNLIDWYDVQYYNQGYNQYLTCQSILWDSGGKYPGTSVFEIHRDVGVPLNKLVIGKPAQPSDASDGYIRENRFNDCLKQAVPNGWRAGAAWWQAPHMSPARLWVVRRGIL